MIELEKVFISHVVEKKWTEKWTEDACFDRKIDPTKPSFCILMPPPNVTGVLHMGHLLNQTLQDVFIRRARHNNKCATWIPGTDHAGISMQVKVEKELLSQGINWKQFGREKFLESACQWRDKHGDVILSQLKRLGVSCDLKNKVHTLDADYSRAVLSAFVEMFKRGYIYRSKRMINWCPKTLTALSDEEVIMTPQQSKLYYVRYEIAEQPGQFIEVSTTRPETIPGDVAIAVNPEDDRYKNLIGCHCVRPINPENIPIISDFAVDKSFGTGALKITPAHDIVDFEVGQRHNLPIIDVINPDGTMNSLAGKELDGLDRFVAREKTAEILSKSGVLIKISDYENNVGFSERGHVPIEPRLSEQWFLKYPKVEEAKRAIEKKIIKFYPQHWAKTYLHWLDGIHDWCISRQLWWGHRIPVWYKKFSDRSDQKNWHVSADGPEDPENWEQDEDVLDTWASSWIWPFGVFGWPDQQVMEKQGFKYFYPTEILVTGPDIIFFWVARMIIASLELMGAEKRSLTDLEIADRIPFKHVYFTGIIRDKIGRKMSKSLGNSPEPLDLIKKYGADGLRFGILLSAPSGQDLIFKEENISLGRNFCNKLWNAFRFSHMNRDYVSYGNLSLIDLVRKIDILKLDIDDQSILLRLIRFCRNFNMRIDDFEVNAALNLVYSFFWDEYAGWYVEASKSRLYDKEETVFAIHDIIMRQLLLILNPFIPFISEELWNIGSSDQERSMFDVYCETADDLEKIFSGLGLRESCCETIDQLKEFVNSVRRSVVGCRSAKAEIIIYIFPQGKIFENALRDYLPKLKIFSGVDRIVFTDEILNLPAIQTKMGSIFIAVDGNNKFDLVIEKSKLLREIEIVSGLIELNESKLQNPKFMGSAPEKVINGAKKMLSENIIKRDELLKLLSTLE